MLKLGVGQEFFFREGGGLPYEGKVRKFSFSGGRGEGGLPYEEWGVIF